MFVSQDGSVASDMAHL